MTGKETCDDGNNATGDGCSSVCLIEDGYICPTLGQLCVSVCGDSKVRGNETCDDGNNATGDGCNSSCLKEVGYDCPTPGSLCVSNCGDTIVAFGA